MQLEVVVSGPVVGFLENAPYRVHELGLHRECSRMGSGLLLAMPLIVIFHPCPQVVVGGVACRPLIAHVVLPGCMSFRIVGEDLKGDTL